MKLSVASPVVVLFGPPVARSVSAVVSLAPAASTTVVRPIAVAESRHRAAPASVRALRRGRPAVAPA